MRGDRAYRTVIFERDPAAKSVLEVILCYFGLHRNKIEELERLVMNIRAGEFCEESNRKS
ncbi:hypothetical protein [Thermoanaerobacter uzonensis]|uniref:hypothetical protein n=1 Tax=Thermoanaerobacter uzonensis TaxID=447593 RepID=UPI000AFDACB4